MGIAEYLEGQIEHRMDFMMVSKRQYMNVCFWYLPKFLRGKSNIMDYSAQLHKVNMIQKYILNRLLFFRYIPEVLPRNTKRIAIIFNLQTSRVLNKNEDWNVRSHVFDFSSFSNETFDTSVKNVSCFWTYNLTNFETISQ